MKHTYLLVLFIISLSAMSYGQQTDILDANNIKARVWYDGDLFWDKLGNPAFEYPAGSGHHANNLSGLWIVGKDANDSLVGAATFKRNNAFTNSDFYGGPLDTTCVNVVDSETMALYKRVWKVSRAEIEMFQLCNCIDPTNPICTGYAVPNSIKQWPGNPIIESGGEHLLMDNRLAPFYDNSGDGIYDWTDCDYPLIKGEQAIFWVMNDQGGLHSVSGLVPMQVEIRCMAYASSCGSFMNDAIFVDYQIVNRCTQGLKDVYIGMYSSADAGNGNDDYIGTNATKGYMYHYNGDAVDAQYNTTPVATATVLLQGPPMRSNGVDDVYDLPSIVSLTDTSTSTGAFGINGRFFNDGIVDNEYLGLTRSIAFQDDSSATGIPTASNHFYNLLGGFWTDNAAMVYAGMGYPSGPFVAAHRARYIYPNNSDPDDVGTSGIATSFDWTEFNNGAGTNVNGQRNLLATTGPIQLPEGEYINLTYAFIPALSSGGADSLGINALELKVDSLLAYHDSVFTILNLHATNGNFYNILCPTNYTVMGVDDEGLAPSQVQVFPNPTQAMVQIQSEGIGFTRYVLFDVAGRLVKEETLFSNPTKLSIDLSAYANGIYYIRLYSGSQVNAQKIIKY